MQIVLHNFNLQKIQILKHRFIQQEIDQQIKKEIQKTVNLRMKPKRPDSAKSRTTQKTLDTQLNQSKFSQTFTSNKPFHESKKDEFEKYLEQKETDPKFKKFNYQSNLPQIEQKPLRPQGSKINSKPFEKRSTKQIIETNQQLKNQTKKIQETKWTVNQPNISKGRIPNKQEATSHMSKSFAQKNKQKLNSVSSGIKKVETTQKKQLQLKKQSKKQVQYKKQVQQKRQAQSKKQVQLKGFKVNIPGKKQAPEPQSTENEFLSRAPIVRPSTAISVVKKSQAQQIRQKQLLQISRFISQVQMRNLNNYPDGYEQFVQLNQSRVHQQNVDFAQIDIATFLREPNQNDYEKVRRRIQKNQKTLHDEELTESRITNRDQTQHTSIDLDRIIDGDSQLNQQKQRISSVFLSAISSKDLKERNLFLTEVLKGRINPSQIEQLQTMDSKQQKFQQLSQEKEEIQQPLELNMMKKKSTRLIEKNIIESSGQVYRDCDYLSEQNKQRLQRLLNGEIEQSPWEIGQWELFAIKRLDEGIRLYRQFNNRNLKDQQIQYDEECLPKDPILRKQAERKLLKDKIDSVNARLRQVDQIVVNQSKIKSLIEDHKQSKISDMSQSLILQKNRQFDQIQEKRLLINEMLANAQAQKLQMQRIIDQMSKQYQQYQKQAKQYAKLSSQEIRQISLQSLSNQRLIIEELSSQMNQLQRLTSMTSDQFSQQISHQLNILRQIQNFRLIEDINLKSYQQNETIEGLDAMFEKRRMEEGKQNYNLNSNDTIQDQIPIVE